jgi:hypothetical protein
MENTNELFKITETKEYEFDSVKLVYKNDELINVYIFDESTTHISGAHLMRAIAAKERIDDYRKTIKIKLDGLV